MRTRGSDAGQSCEGHTAAEPMSHDDPVGLTASSAAGQESLEHILAKQNWTFHAVNNHMKPNGVSSVQAHGVYTLEQMEKTCIRGSHHYTL